MHSHVGSDSSANSGEASPSVGDCGSLCVGLNWDHNGLMLLRA